MAARRVGNLLGLAVLAVLAERPMHRYEMAGVITARSKDRQLAVKLSSLYTVTDNLARHGFIEVTGTDRDGARPERTIYRITAAGLAEMRDWTRQLLGEPRGDADPFVAGLSVLAALSPDEAVDLLSRRLAILDDQAVALREQLRQGMAEVARLFLVEDEYALAQLDSQRGWLRKLLTELTDGTFPGLEQWRALAPKGDSVTRNP